MAVQKTLSSRSWYFCSALPQVGRRLYGTPRLGPSGDVVMGNILRAVCGKHWQRWNTVKGEGAPLGYYSFLPV